MILIIALFSPYNRVILRIITWAILKCSIWIRRRWAGVRKEVGFEDAPNLINISRSMIVIFF